MDTLTRGLNRFFETIMAWLPNLAGALLVLILGSIIASVLASAVRKLLTRLELSERLHTGHGGSVLERAVPEPEKFLSKILYWAVMLGVISLAVSVLGIPALTNFVAAIYAYLPNVFAALLIFLVAGAVAAAVSTIAMRVLGDTPTGKIVATAVPFVVMGIATFMILDQLGIAETIVTITYAALMGAAALGLALAFGLGGRDVAAQLLGDAYRKGMEQRQQVKQDVALGRDRAQAEVKDVIDKQRRRR
ncbi:hypothetical protein JNJ66_03685 [Candidatus Saccharibacteria bacterium]|nr:hypothetical protein [Candidatus Saccharibacteria bacterium]